MSTETFYADLAPLDNFADITKAAKFVPVPNDWYVLITDIVESTKAIEQGRYKDVNLLGACSIIAVLNVAQKIDIPFVFGGDGASMLIPPILYTAAKQALLAMQQLAQSEFNLNLRIGIVPVSTVTDANYALKIARLKVSENYSQAVVTGGGLTYATQLVKSSDDDNLYRLMPSETFENVDLSGLECRWQDLPSLHEEILSLIVLETSQASRNSYNVYQKVIDQIETIYGDDLSYHPVSDQNTNLTFCTEALIKETKLRAKSRRWFDKLLYLWKIKLENLLGLVFMRFKLKFGEMDWGIYKKNLTNATDYRKFDDMLRLVMSGTVVQREALVNYLEAQYKAGNLVYGTHISDRALMTCLVFEHNGPQVHFIDGADGGYTLAAKAMKVRMHRKVLNWNAYVSLNKRQQHLFN
ncbi:MAG: DUF3095 domain-containing protein [Tildeniella nuda ZEHNDER 1965/U140]|jgi:hypothetical protein|nr:DUF3095 domain-containing protein [Tildeniella nuda ZEHNDER 1965/U140]